MATLTALHGWTFLAAIGLLFGLTAVLVHSVFRLVDRRAGRRQGKAPRGE